VSAMTWDSFLDVYPRSHLVVAWLHGRHRTGEARRARFDLLARIATALEPRGDWAMTDANPREIYFAYANAADAAQLCTLVGARPLGLSIQWLSQAAFKFQGESRKSATDLLKGVGQSSHRLATPPPPKKAAKKKPLKDCPHDGRRHARNASRNGVLSKARSPCSARTSPQGIATQATQKTG
jgi:hypothetical protein